MPMPRAQMLSILNAMSDDNLIAALGAAGVDTGYEAMDLGAEETEGLQSWNDRPVEIQDTPRPPLTVRQGVMQSQPVKRPYMERVGPGLGDEQDDFAAQQGPDGNALV